MLTSFAYRAFRAARIASVLLVAREQLSYVDIAEVDPNRPVNEPIDQGIRLHAAAEAPVPLRGSVLGAENRRARHVATLDQLEQEAYRHVVHVLGEPLVICEARVYAKPTELIQVDRDCGHIDFA